MLISLLIVTLFFMGSTHSVYYDAGEFYRPRTGFLSKKWIKDVAKQASAVNESEWKKIRSGLVGAMQKDQDPKELEYALSHVSDAVIVYDMVHTDHPMLHELAYQLSFSPSLRVMEKEKWDANEKQRVKWLYEELVKEKEDVEREERGDPPLERFRAVGREKSIDWLKPMFMDPRPYDLEKAKEGQRKAAERFDWRFQRLHTIMTHPVLAKYLICPWYTDKYGNTPIGRMTPSDSGVSKKPIQSMDYFYPLLHEMLGDEIDSRTGYGESNHHRQYEASQYMRAGNIKAFRKKLAEIMARPVKKTTLRFMRNELPRSAAAARKKKFGSLVNMIEKFFTVPKAEAKK